MLLGSTPPEANGLPATGRQRAVPADPQHRDLIAAGVDREQIPSMVGELDRVLRADARAEAGAAGRERRAGQSGQRAVRVADEPGDRVRPGGVAVEVHVLGGLVQSLSAVGGRNCWTRHRDCEQRDRDRHARKETHRCSLLVGVGRPLGPDVGGDLVATGLDCGVQLSRASASGPVNVRRAPLGFVKQATEPVKVAVTNRSHRRARPATRTRLPASGWQLVHSPRSTRRAPRRATIAFIVGPPRSALALWRHCDSGRPSSRAAQQGLSARAAEPTLHMRPVESAQLDGSPAYGDQQGRASRCRTS